MLFCLLIPPPPRSTLFPYTTLFRSSHARHARRDVQNHSGAHAQRHLPSRDRRADPGGAAVGEAERARRPGRAHAHAERSEEHTSELQSRQYLVCRLLLEKKKKKLEE